MRQRPQKIPFALLTVTCLALAACAPRPAFKAADGTDVTQAPYPTLLPFEALTAPPAPPPGLVQGLVAQGAALAADAAAQRVAQ